MSLSGGKMSFSSTLIVSAVLLMCFSYARASVIPRGKIVEPGNSGEFKVHILESGTEFAEKIEIDEEKEIEYFHVPAHNGLTEADFLYDFKNKMEVTRVKSEAKCYLGPLPNNLPKPADLKTALQMVSQPRPSEHNIIVQHYWTVSEQVNKTLLRQEVQDFCGQFPVFVLRKVQLDSTTGLIKKDQQRTRIARDLVRANLSGLPFCKDNPLPTLDPNGNPGCSPDDYEFVFKIRETHCTWYLVCKFSEQAESVLCDDWEHKYNSMICYSVRCPPKTETLDQTPAH